MNEVESIMLQAKSSALGLEVKCSNAELFQRRFHAARNNARKRGETIYDDLRCRIVSQRIVFLLVEQKKC